MPFFYFDYYYLVLVVPALLIALWAQVKVKSTFSRFSTVRCSRGLTGAQAAEEILRQNGIYDVRIERVAGQLTDHFDPRAKVIRLSDSVYGASTVAAVGVAAHEAGHAVQYARGYAPIRLRNAIIPVCNIGSTLSMPLVLLGIVFSMPMLVTAGVLLFSLVTVFQLVTLPVEFNASSRAIAVLGDSGMLESGELAGARKVLSAAAMTYVAALLVSLMNLLRLILLTRRSRD